MAEVVVANGTNDLEIAFGSETRIKYAPRA